MSLNSLARRLDRLEMLVRSGWIDHFRRVVEVHKSIERRGLKTDEWGFIMKSGYVPRSLGREAIFHQLKMFVKEAPPPDHPAWDGIDDLLWYVEPRKDFRWDWDAWANVWRFAKLFRRMPIRRGPVRSDKWRWLRGELAGLRLHMGEQTFDPKAELRALGQRPGRLVWAVMEDSRPPSEARKEATRLAKVERRRARRRVRRDAVLARKAIIRQALGKPPAEPVTIDEDARLFGGLSPA